MIANELDDLGGRIAEIEIDELVAIIVDQVDDEITVQIASFVGVDFQGTGRCRRGRGEVRSVSRDVVADRCEPIP
ncbi:hypothetical protein BE61_20790 [Bradyrhizobium elkanii USDA 61]|nr:hypothetical protein QIH80_05035 [Bradyrhizobium elkanii]BBB96648.1 hypothetical protein BE61_20790 [Bradyrhizobium elkanii USDA 61]